MICFVLAVLIPGLYREQVPEKVDAIKRAGITRVYSPAAHVGAWKAAGIDTLDSTALAQFTVRSCSDGENGSHGCVSDSHSMHQREWLAVPARLETRVLQESASRVSRYGRGGIIRVRRRPVLQPSAKDLDDLLEMVAFLGNVQGEPMPAMANLGVLDDGSPLLGEVMNLLSRRNLLYRVVPKPGLVSRSEREGRVGTIPGRGGKES